jgi:hypothetical protein
MRVRNVALGGFGGGVAPLRRWYLSDISRHYYRLS